MFTLVCPRCGSGRYLQTTAALPLRAWLHCGSCNHLWKTSGVGLLCRWIIGGGFRARVPAVDDTRGNPVEIPVTTPTSARPAPMADAPIEEWLGQAADETPRGTDISVTDWLETDPLEEPARTAFDPFQRLAG